MTEEELGDRVRRLLGRDADAVEQVELLSRTPGTELSDAARRRIGMTHGQENLLVRIVLRHATRSVAKPEANALRDRVYAALHEGTTGVYTASARS